MEQGRQERLVKKYASSKAGESAKKELNIPGRSSRGRAMGVSEKPKNLNRTVFRLMKYLSHEKGMLTAAIGCCLLCTLSTLAASMMLLVSGMTAVSQVSVLMLYISALSVAPAFVHT